MTALRKLQVMRECTKLPQQKEVEGATENDSQRTVNCLCMLSECIYNQSHDHKSDDYTSPEDPFVLGCPPLNQPHDSIREAKSVHHI